MPRLLPPFAPSKETQHLVRTRKFDVRSIDEVSGVLAALKRERFVGVLRIGIGPGGTPQFVESEQHGKIDT